MKLEQIVCDSCGKPPHKIHREYLAKVFCSLDCWLDFWSKDWAQWQEQYLKTMEPTVPLANGHDE